MSSLAFDVLSQLLIHLLESLVVLGKQEALNFLATRDRTEFILDQTLAWIISQVRLSYCNTPPARPPLPLPRVF